MTAGSEALLLWVRFWTSEATSPKQRETAPLSPARSMLKSPKSSRTSTCGRDSPLRCPRKRVLLSERRGKLTEKVKHFHCDPGILKRRALLFASLILV